MGRAERRPATSRCSRARTTSCSRRGRPSRSITASAALENGFGPGQRLAEPARARPAAHGRDDPELRRRTCPGGAARSRSLTAFTNSCNVIVRRGRAGARRGGARRRRRTRSASARPTRRRDRCLEADDPVRHPVRDRACSPTPSTSSRASPLVAISAIGQDNDLARTRCRWRSSPSAIANGGVMMEPSLVTRGPRPAGPASSREFGPELYRPAAISENDRGAITRDDGQRRRERHRHRRADPRRRRRGQDRHRAARRAGADPHAWFVCFAPAGAGEVPRSRSRLSSWTAVASGARRRAARWPPRSREQVIEAVPGGLETTRADGWRRRSAGARGPLPGGGPELGSRRHGRGLPRRRTPCSDRTVAIKILAPAVRRRRRASSTASGARHRRRRGSNHPNIVGVYDSGVRRRRRTSSSWSSSRDGRSPTSCAGGGRFTARHARRDRREDLPTRSRPRTRRA